MGGMSFELSESQRSLVAHTDAFARKTLAGRSLSKGFDPELWKELGHFGALGLTVSSDWGGLGLSALDAALVLERLAYASTDLGILFAASAHMFACAMPILRFGSTAQKEHWLPKIARGEFVAANAISEAEAGSDAFALKARAERVGDAYVLNGLKTYVSNGPTADVFVVYACTQPEDGYLGISAFLVARGTRGITVGTPFEKTGLHGAETASVSFQDCRVPKDTLLGREGNGGSIFRDSMLWERACLFAIYVGAMERDLGRAIEHAKNRRQFGKPIAQFQAVSHRIAEMRIRLEGARWLLYRSCWALEHDPNPASLIAISKVAVVEAALANGVDLIKTFGGQGAMPETGGDSLLRDVLPATAFSGTADVQKGIIARELGL